MEKLLKSYYGIRFNNQLNQVIAIRSLSIISDKIAK